MFEKEAEEYVMRKDVITENDRVPFDNGYGFQTVSFEDEVKKGFKDGAEFGYNKANEWHKGELPQVTDKNKETLYLAWTKYGRAGSPCIVTPLKVKYINLWTGAIVDKEDVVSWKEIELPTE